MAKQAEPLVRPNAPLQEIRPAWNETYEECLRRSLFEEDAKLQEDTEQYILKDQ